VTKRSGVEWITSPKCAVSQGGMKLFRAMKLEAIGDGHRFLHGLGNANDKSVHLGLVNGVRLPERGLAQLGGNSCGKKSVWAVYRRNCVCSFGCTSDGTSTRRNTASSRGSVPWEPSGMFDTETATVYRFARTATSRWIPREEPEIRLNLPKEERRLSR
jgi:hypothetical protein